MGTTAWFTAYLKSGQELHLSAARFAIEGEGDGKRVVYEGADESSSGALIFLDPDQVAAIVRTTKPAAEGETPGASIGNVPGPDWQTYQ